MSEQAPKDWPSMRPALHAQTLAVAIKFLGDDSERDARQLADSMMGHLDNILAAGGGVVGGVLAQKGQHPEITRVAAEISEQTRQHSQELVDTAFMAMAAMFTETLRVAARRER